MPALGILGDSLRGEEPPRRRRHIRPTARPRDMSPRRRPLHAALLLAPLAMPVSCADAPALEPATEQLRSTCADWGCGESVAVLDTLAFHELDEAGAPNSAGIRLLGLTQRGRAYTVDVVDNQLFARALAPSRDGDLSGEQLEGAELSLSTPAGIYAIHLRAVSQVPYWVGEATPNEVYHLEYTDPSGSEARPLCSNPPDAAAEWPEPTAALLFTGDRYDAVGKRVIAGAPADPGQWFNIACAGSALAKLHLSRHTPAGSSGEFTSTTAQRQALLKMFTADMCGTGQAFTEEGTPLRWGNATGTKRLRGDEASLEALWSEDGALCLDEHRLDVDADDPDAEEIHGEVVRACEAVGKPLPPCTDLPGFPRTWPPGAYVLSANPRRD